MRTSLARRVLAPLRASMSTTTTAPASSSSGQLSWPEFLSIRRARRRWELATTIPSTILCGVGGGAYFFSLEGDSSVPLFGIDPLYVYAAAGIGSTGLGYLIGPSIGGWAWRMSHRARLALIDARERELHKRILKYRVPPELTPANNPRLPDFYGEKIGSLHDYRRWLRDQARYKRKAEWSEGEGA
ncbi:mitochondrial import protein Pam17 [Auriculariales sp. MPI-PUGE-AT-0066]|nr:mitochondrial import protein Pam17 [Auriculariales sp. MPI-PUGE-AT-0066]